MKGRCTEQPGALIHLPAVVPRSIEPMHPTLVRQPFHRDGWVYERKEDGWRMLVYKDGSRVRLVSRRGVDHAARFPGVTAAIAKLSERALILDGEVCIRRGRVRVLLSMIMIATLASAVAGCASSGSASSGKTESAAAAWAERDRLRCQGGGGNWRPAIGVCESRGGGGGP